MNSTQSGMAENSMIAVTGATGLIGSAIARSMSDAHRVVTIGRGAGSDLRADISDPTSVAALDLGGADVLIHAAGIVDEDFSDPARAFRQAILGMDALVKNAKTAGVRRFVYISSGHVYGPYVGTINETSWPNPLHDYAIAHFASEQILRRNSSPQFRAAAFRPCAVFGIPPDLSRFRRWGLIPFGFPRSAVADGEIKLASRGIQRRNFVGTQDIAEAIAAWLNDEKVASFTPINPVGAASMTVFEFAQLCADVATKMIGDTCRITRPNGADSAPDSFHYTTVDQRYVGNADLSSTVERLMRLLAK